jgi:hypothetical protein
MIIIFQWKKHRPGPWLMTSARVTGPRFHRGLHSGRRQGLAGARPSGRPGLRKLAATAREGRGARQGSVLGLTRGGGVMWMPGDGGAESEAVALGGSDA